MPLIASLREAKCTRCGGVQVVVNGYWLRHLREQARLSLREFARRQGVSAPFLSDVERNRRNCSRKLEGAYLRLTKMAK